MNRLPLILSAVIIAAGLTSCKSKADKPAKEEPKAGPQQGSIVYFNLDRVVKEYDMANDLRSVVNTKVSGINQEVNRRGSKLQQDINSFQDKVNKGLLTQSTAQVQNSQLQEQQSNFTNWEDTYRVTAGLGYNIDRFNIDLAYQYSTTNGKFSPFYDYADNMNTDCLPNNNFEQCKVSNKRHQLMLTLGYRF